MGDLAALDNLVTTCFACPRLVAWREEVALVRRAAFAAQTYWGRAVPGFGPDDAAVLIVGLAPAAHGANRTGRMFTGDRSGDFLFAAMYAAGLATQPTAESIDDGLALIGARVSSPVHCAPPDNAPTPQERNTCAPFLARELELLAPTLRSVVVLGAFGWQALFSTLAAAGWAVPRPRPKFTHGARVVVDHPDGRSLAVFGCFHVSQHNTFTGRLTPSMLEAVLRAAAAVADEEGTTMSNVALRRIYEDLDEHEQPGEGARVLVDRLWPRGISKDRADLTEWCKAVAPSTELRKWYAHDPAKFAEFTTRYLTELDTNDEQAAALAHLRELAAAGPLVLLTATKDPSISEAQVLYDILIGGRRSND